MTDKFDHPRKDAKSTLSDPISAATAETCATELDELSAKMIAAAMSLTRSVRRLSSADDRAKEIALRSIRKYGNSGALCAVHVQAIVALIDGGITLIEMPETYRLLEHRKREDAERAERTAAAVLACKERETPDWQPGRTESKRVAQHGRIYLGWLKAAIDHLEEENGDKDVAAAVDDLFEGRRSIHGVMTQVREINNLEAAESKAAGKSSATRKKGTGTTMPLGGDTNVVQLIAFRREAPGTLPDISAWQEGPERSATRSCEKTRSRSRLFPTCLR